MSRPSPRYTFERRARIRRTLQLRRRRQVRRASALVLSLSVLAASGIAVATIARTLGVDAKATPLYALTPEREIEVAPAPAAVPSVDVAPVAVEPAPAAPAPEPATVDVEATTNDVRMFNGRAVKPVRTIRMLVTAYSPDARSCGKYADGITASGYSVWTNGGKLVAADTRILPFGSLLSVPGYDSGDIVPVLDVGGKIKGNRLDLLFPTHAQARQWGKQWLDVTVYDYAD